MGDTSGIDVFVSYAHADNEVPEGTSAKVGWVTALAHNLNTGPNVYKKDLFIDHQLKPGDVFDEDLINKVERSSLLLLLLSQNYIDSDWCGRELAHFVRAHGNDPEKPADVFVVELFPYEQFTAVPNDIQNLRKRLIHAKFWHHPRSAGSPHLAGFPTPRASGEDGEVHYWRVLNELRYAVDARLRAQKRDAWIGRVRLPSAASPTAIDNSVRKNLGTVLLADVTEELEGQRSAVKAALEPEGITVLPEGDYIGLTQGEFDAAITEDIKRCGLFVQLLSTTPGRKGKGFSAPLPQLQYRHAVASRLPIMQWCEQLPPPGQITDPDHGRLFETEFLRATNLASFKMEVIERMLALRVVIEKNQVREYASSSTTDPKPEKRLVFVDDLASQPKLNEKLRAIIRDQNYEIRSLPPNAPLGNNGIDTKEVLKPCCAGLTIYTDRNKYATAYNRLVFFLNQIAEAKLSLARWGVYLEEGDVASIFGIYSNDVVGVNEHNLVTFLQGL